VCVHACVFVCAFSQVHSVCVHICVWAYISMVNKAQLACVRTEKV